MTKDLEIEVTRENAHYAVITLRGEATFTYVNTFKKKLLGAAEVRGRRGMILDCRDLTYMDSSALGIIVAVHTTLNRKNGRLILAEPQRGIISILDVSRLRKLIPNTKSLKQATRDMEDFLGIPPHEEA
jgi:anti-anti-sigma factor